MFRSFGSSKQRPSMDEEKEQFLNQLSQYINDEDRKRLVLIAERRVKGVKFSPKSQARLVRKEQIIAILTQLKTEIESSERLRWNIALQTAMEAFKKALPDRQQKSNCQKWLTGYSKRYQALSSGLSSSEVSVDQLDNGHHDALSLDLRNDPPPTFEEALIRAHSDSTHSSDLPVMMQLVSVEYIATAICMVQLFIEELQQEIKNRYFAFLNRWFPVKQKKVEALNSLCVVLQTFQTQSAVELNMTQWQKTIEDHVEAHPVLLKNRFSHRTFNLLTNLRMMRPERGILDSFSPEKWQAKGIKTTRWI